jgi:hypothetical protein
MCSTAHYGWVCRDIWIYWKFIAKYILLSCFKLHFWDTLLRKAMWMWWTVMVHEGSNSQPIILCVSQTFRPLLFMSIDFFSLYLMCNLAFVFLLCQALKLFHCLVYITITIFRVNDAEGENYLMCKSCIDPEGGRVRCCTVHWAIEHWQWRGLIQTELSLLLSCFVLNCNALCTGQHHVPHPHCFY